ncbi:hypothetical protein SAY86_006213 [Trapa natans]|uniref:Uncharacterized protein n=1 Tax=Trapa natans TaxID=22666 RepID=A0AAN7QWK2_TRANT|nr:hypothetical protein SAY86_006213 [Trapa natans]
MSASFSLNKSHNNLPPSLFFMLFEKIKYVFTSEGKVQGRAMEQAHEQLKLLEEGLKGCIPGGFPDRIVEGKEDMGLLDMVMSSPFLYA